MDGFEVNKILGAILGTVLLIVAMRNVTDAIFEKEPLETNAFPVAVASTGADGGHATAPAALDLPKLLAEAKPERGQRVAEKCLSCHTFAKGAPNSTGPNLWGVVGGPVAHLGDAFAYSTAMRKFGGAWTYDRLFTYLENPQGVVSGTKMTFAGLSKPTDRADIIAYMRQQSDSPPPLPELAAPAPEAGGAAPQSADAPGMPAEEGGVTGAPEAGPSPSMPAPATPQNARDPHGG
jgi:cytochrome c